MQGAERRQLTLMFCDLVGSTALSSQLDPEDLRDLLAAYQSRCATAVANYNGFIANYIGDGLLIYFGYPAAHEDDAERALLAALDIIEAINALNAEYSDGPAGLDIRVRIGIATGLVVVGDARGAATRDTVTGDAANLAARLQEAAAPNTVVVSSLTRQLAADRFEYQDLGERTLKGFPTPIRLHQVLRERLVTRFEARSATLTPFVGRETELASLLAAWRDARTAGGQVILVVGEAGLGKSRLAAELRERVRHMGGLPPDADNAAVVQCSPHHVHTTLHPLVKHLERLARIRREDSPDTRLAKLRSVLTSHIPPDALETVATLLGAAPPDSALTTPAATRQRTIDAVTAWLTALAAGPAPIITVEDVQWIDPTSRTVLARLARAIGQLPALLIITLRPTARLTAATFLAQTGLAPTPAAPPDPAAPQVTTLELRPLDILSARRLAAEVTAGALTRPQLAAVLDRSEGIPLYIEELTKTAVKGLAATPVPPGGASPDLVPDAINDTLMAQLDQLGPAKHVVQFAAVIGQEFSTPLLAAVAAQPPQALEEHLRRLVAAGIILPGPKYTDGYRFRHGLICDIAYRSLLRKSRRQVHLALAAELLRTANNPAPENPAPENPAPESPAPNLPPHDLVARHLSLGHEPAAALEHWQLGARAAIARSAHEEAVGMLEAALADYEKLPGPPQSSLKIDLLLAMAVALRASRGYSAPEVEQKLREARALCEHSRDDSKRFNVEWGLFQCTMVGGDIPAAERIAHSLYRHAERHPDRPLVDAFLANGMTAQQLGDFARAAALFESGLAASQLETDPPRFYTHGQNPGLFCLSYLARTQCFLGAIDTARVSIARALAVAASRANDPGHIYGHVNALLHAVRVHNLCGDGDAEERLALETMRLADRNQFAYYKAQATCHLAWVTAARDNLPLGIAQLETAIAGLSQTGTELGLTGFYALLAQLYLQAGRPADAAQTLEHAVARKNAHLRIWDAELERVRADILAQSSDPAAAEAAYRRSLAIAARQRAGLFTLRTALHFGQFLRRTDRALEARNLLAATLQAQPPTPHAEDAPQPPITQSVRALLDQIVCDTNCLN